MISEVGHDCVSRHGYGVWWGMEIFYDGRLVWLTLEGKVLGGRNVMISILLLV